MKKRDKVYIEPFYVRKPKLTLLISFSAIVFAIITILFVFGRLDSFINVNNWRVLYLVVAGASITNFVIICIFMFKTWRSSIDLITRYVKKKKMPVIFKQIDWGSVIFNILTLVGSLYFFVCIVGIPILKDALGKLETYTGDCIVHESFNFRGPNTRYVIFKKSTGVNLKIIISNTEYIKLKSIEKVEYSQYKCSSAVNILYTPNFGKAIYIESIK